MNLEAKDLLDVTVSPRYQGMQTQIEQLATRAIMLFHGQRMAVHPGHELCVYSSGSGKPGPRPDRSSFLLFPLLLFYL